MNSPFANIFLAIQQQIQASVTTITYIDQDLGQLKTATARPPVSWPCVLIDFEEFNFDNMGENIQTAKGTVVLRLGFAPYSSSTQVTPTAYIQQAIGYYDIEWALHQAIQGWAPGGDYGHLIRTSASTQKRTDNYRVRELRYSIAFEDYSTKPQQQLAPATLIVNETMTL
jgi:hypothetical protein